MKLGEKYKPPKIVRDTYDWWSGQEYYEVVQLDKELFIIADDGDTYDLDFLESCGYLGDRDPEYKFTLVLEYEDLENV